MLFVFWEQFSNDRHALLKKGQFWGRFANMLSIFDLNLTIFVDIEKQWGPIPGPLGARRNMYLSAQVSGVGTTSRSFRCLKVHVRYCVRTYTALFPLGPTYKGTGENIANISQTYNKDIAKICIYIYIHMYIYIYICIHMASPILATAYKGLVRPHGSQLLEFCPP